MEEENLQPILPFNYTNIYANAPEPPQAHPEFYVVRGNNYKNAVYAESEKVDCVNNLKSFEQYSGQCWSDAASIFLLFSNEVGKKTQHFLAAENSFSDYIKWCYRNKYFIEDIRGIAFNTYDEFEQFIFFSTAYLECLQNRFKTWKKNKENQSEALSCKLIVYSYCQESVGILAGALLNFSGLMRRNIDNAANTRGIPIRDYFGKIITEYLDVNERDDLQKAALLDRFFLHSFGIESRGYDNREFGKVIAVYLKFLNKDIIFEPHPEFILRIIREEPTKSIFYYDPVASIKEFVNVKLINTINALVKTHYINMTAQLKVGKGWHAITFLTCENNQQIIYDNNRGELVEAYWCELYKFPVGEAIGGNYQQYYLFHDDTPKEEKLTAFHKFVKIAIEQAKLKEDEPMARNLEMMVALPHLNIFFNPAIICVAYNVKTFTLTFLKKHIKR
jgi:hypothetical protein